MSNFKDLKLYPNMPPVQVQFVFDSPRSFPSKRNADELRFAYRLKLLEDHREYRAGDEVSLWTSNPKHVERLNAFRKGDRVAIQCPQEPGERAWKLVVRELAMEEGPVYSDPRPSAGPVSNTNAGASATPNGNGANGNAEADGITPATVVRMGESLAEAYESVLYAADLLRTRHGDEVGDGFAEAMTSPDILQKTGVTLFIGKDRR